LTIGCFPQAPIVLAFSPLPITLALLAFEIACRLFGVHIILGQEMPLIAEVAESPDFSLHDCVSLFIASIAFSLAALTMDCSLEPM
jgi:hypothetical protein